MKQPKYLLDIRKVQSQRVKCIWPKESRCIYLSDIKVKNELYLKKCPDASISDK